jgi:hypothetical protein
MCAILEEPYTFNYPFLLPIDSLIFSHVTQPVRLATHINQETLTIIDAYKYSTTCDLNIWTVPIKAYRLFDLATYKQQDHTLDFVYNFESNPDYSKLVDEIVTAIARYNIVYFKNLTYNYPQLFQDVGQRFNAVKPELCGS